MSIEFERFFQKALGDSTRPYPYQTRFAVRDDIPHLVRAPTSAGKTATVSLGWLYKRKTRPGKTPRRLVYCLPMRVLVEQTEREIRHWIANLGLDLPVYVLMGGVEVDRWYLHPEQPAVLIGTQDMILSRGLNRGYAASRFHWPIDFGLLNNDCLWVFDEPQLMAAGVSTSAQLAGLRRDLETFGDCPSVWMSATLEPAWLNTIDFRGKSAGVPLVLSDDDYDPSRPLHQRMEAEKTIALLQASSSNDMKDIAKAILGSSEEPRVHQPDTQTLVVVNTVDRAKALYEQLLKLRKKSPKPSLLLVHSRFRPSERRQLNERLQQPASDRIIVATQVVEAGVDISARTLVTELSPWSSLVQRMGRCNRTGRDGPGQVYWIDLGEKHAAPYSLEDLEFAREQAQKLDGQSVSPRDLDRFKEDAGFTLPFEHRHVLRRRDLLDLFDTAPDLSGNDIDIQRFVRSDDPDIDVQVFWRAIGKQPPLTDEAAPHRNELCNVPVHQVQDFLKARAGKKRGVGHFWDHLDEEWRPVEPKQIRPGMVILLSAELGGYDWNTESQSGKGWDIGSESLVESVEHNRNGAPEGTSSDPNSALGGRPLTIAEHTKNVCNELKAILDSLGIADPWRSYLMQAALWHDVGKAHATFQAGVRGANADLATDQLWAKSGRKGRLQYSRRYFRHELVSALAVLQQGLDFVVAYLACAHHGRARLSIRTLPDECHPETPDTLYALGVHHGDELPAVDLGVKSCPALRIDLTPMQLGGERSWTASALKLLADLGPFRLAYLESLLRAADVRASQKEADHD